MFEPYFFERNQRNAHLSKLEHSDEIIKKLFDWTSNPTNILYFCGNVGNGKSYFASAFYNFLAENKKNVRCYSESYLFQELKLCMQIPSWQPEYRVKTICESEFLILDDLGSTLSSDKDKSEWKKEILFNILDLRYNSGMPTLITSNLCKSEIQNIFHDRFSSRLYASVNTIIEINEPDRRQITG